MWTLVHSPPASHRILDRLAVGRPAQLEHELGLPQRCAFGGRRRAQVKGGQDDVALLDRLRIGGDELNAPLTTGALAYRRVQGRGKGLSSNVHGRDDHLAGFALKRQCPQSLRPQQIDVRDALQAPFTLGTVRWGIRWEQASGTIGRRSVLYTGRRCDGQSDQTDQADGGVAPRPTAHARAARQPGHTRS